MSKIIEVPTIGNVEFPDEMSAADIESSIKQSLVQRESPAASDPALATIKPEPGIMSQVASGAWQGVKNIGSGIASLPGAVYGAIPNWTPSGGFSPGRVAEDIKALATNPSEAIPEQTGRAVQMAKGMIPMYETGKSLITGNAPSAETVSREATEAGLGYLGGKYAIPSAVGAAKKVTKSLPGASVELNELSAAKLRDIPETVRPSPGAVHNAYTLLDQINAPKVAMGETAQTIVNLIDKEATLASPDKAFVKLLRKFQSKIGQGMSFKDIQNNAVDLGEKIGQIAANKGTRLNELRDLLKAVHTDAAQAIPVGGTSAHPALQVKSGVWDAARLLARRDFAANDLTRMIEKSGITTVGDGFTQVNANKLVTQIEDMMKLAKQDKKARLFVESFNPGELEGIVSTIRDIGKSAPKVPAKAGTPVGSSQRMLEISLGGLAGTVAGGIAGHPGFGATVGSLSGPIASHLIAKAMMSDTGRALVRRAMSPTGQITPQGAALLGAFLKAQGQEQP